MDERLKLVKNKLAEICMMGNITDYTPYAEQLLEELAKAHPDREKIRTLQLELRQVIGSHARNESMSLMERKENSDLAVEHFLDEILSLIDPEAIRREERKVVGEWLADEYDATPRNKRVGLLETVIDQLIGGQSLKSRLGGGE